MSGEPDVCPREMGFKVDLGLMAKPFEPNHVHLPFGLDDTHGNITKAEPIIHCPSLHFIVKLKFSKVCDLK